MPTFLFYRNKVKIDMLRGADPAALEEKIKKWYQDEEDDGDGDMRIKGHVCSRFRTLLKNYHLCDMTGTMVTCTSRVKGHVHSCFRTLLKNDQLCEMMGTMGTYTSRGMYVVAFGLS